MEKAIWRQNKEKEIDNLKKEFKEIQEETKKEFSGKEISRGNWSYIFQRIDELLFKKLLKELKESWKTIQRNNEEIWKLEKEIDKLKPKDALPKQGVKNE